MQTMLSDEEMVQWHRHSCLCVFAEPKTRRIAHTVASLAIEILIANPRLEFELSCTKEGLLEISNREYIAIFYFATTDQPTFSNFQELTARPQILIANARLEFRLNHRKDSPLKISNRERIAILHLRSHALGRKGRRLEFAGRGPSFGFRSRTGDRRAPPSALARTDSSV